MRTKYQLPATIKLPQFQFDICRLQQELLKIADSFDGVLQANGLLCTNNHELVSKVYDHFEQINLTEYDGCEENEMGSVENCTIIGETLNEEVAPSKVTAYRQRSRLTKKLDGRLNEHRYSKPTALYTGSYFEEIVNSFKEKAIRVRITKLVPGEALPPHIDYDPTYAARIIIPIFTNEKCINQFWVRGELQEHHLKADGGAYFLNTGFKHAVVNTGETPRIALMFSLAGQADLESIPDVC